MKGKKNIFHRNLISSIHIIIFSNNNEKYRNIMIFPLPIKNKKSLVYSF